jgi:putative membrane protein
MQSLWSVFFYASNWNLKLNLLFILGAVLYLLLTSPIYKRFRQEEAVTGWKKTCFLSGLILFNFAVSSPLELLAHELFSVHMLQMSIAYFMVPPLLLLGMPGYLVQPLFEAKVLGAVLRFFTRPLISLFFFNGLISFYHVPVVFDTIMKSHVLHFVVHSVLLFAAMCMWWPIIAPVPELDRVKPLYKLALIVANGMLLTPACALITFTDTVLFSTYSHGSNLFPTLTPLFDQQAGGVIMKVAQELVYGTALGIVFVRWFREQRARDEQELMEWKRQREQEESLQEG